MTRENNLYTRLGIPVDATPEEIRRAYREAARRLHPDVNVEAGQTELFLDVQQAYEVLSDPTKKNAYDQSIPASQKQSSSVTLNINYSRATIPKISDAQLIYTLIELSAQSEEEVNQPPPINLCLVLDRSTSMQGTLLDTVKSTAIELIRALRVVDTLSVVAFSDRAEVLVPAANHLDRAQAENRIRMLQTFGGTEIYQGLAAGFAEIQRFINRNQKNHLILITDGRTYGDEERCLTLARQAAEVGVSITGMGIGNKWNDAFLDNLASTTGGNSMYVAKPKDIRKFLKDKFQELNQSYAENITVHFELGEGVTLRYAFRLQPDTAPLETKTPSHFGSLPGGGNLSVLLEFEVEPQPANLTQTILMNGRIVFDVPSRSVPVNILRLMVSRPTSNLVENESPPASIIQAMARLTLYRMQERVRKDVEDGRIREATRRLQHIATHLLAQGNRELARTVLAEANYLQQHQTFSEDGEKNLKYGTRNLLMPSNVEDKSP